MGEYAPLYASVACAPLRVPRSVVRALLHASVALCSPLCCARPAARFGRFVCRSAVRALLRASVALCAPLCCARPAARRSAVCSALLRAFAALCVLS